MTFYGTKHLHFKNRQNCKVSLWILWSYSPRQTSKANLSIQMFSTELGKVLFARSIAFLVLLSFWCCKINLQYAIIDIRSTFVLKPSSSPVFSVHNVNIVCIVQTKQKLKCVPRLLLICNNLFLYVLLYLSFSASQLNDIIYLGLIGCPRRHAELCRQE